MEKQEINYFRWIVPYLKKLKANASVIFSIGALIFAGYAVIVQGDLIDDYSHSLDVLSYHDVRAELIIVNTDFSNQTYQIPIMYRVPDFDNNSHLERWLYISEKADLNITNDFRFVFIKIFIEDSAFILFPQIVSEWIVEDNTGTFRRYDFIKSDTLYGFYEYMYDISRYMWKDDVPEKITVKTSLFA